MSEIICRFANKLPPPEYYEDADARTKQLGAVICNRNIHPDGTKAYPRTCDNCGWNPKVARKRINEWRQRQAEAVGHA